MHVVVSDVTICLIETDAAASGLLRRLLEDEPLGSVPPLGVDLGGFQTWLAGPSVTSLTVHEVVAAAEVCHRSVEICSVVEVAVTHSDSPVPVSPDDTRCTSARVSAGSHRKPLKLVRTDDQSELLRQSNWCHRLPTTSTRTWSHGPPASGVMPAHQAALLASCPQQQRCSQPRRWALQQRSAMATPQCQVQPRAAPRCAPLTSCFRWHMCPAGMAHSKSTLVASQQRWNTAKCAWPLTGTEPARHCSKLRHHGRSCQCL
jgi:hypothetical protein